MNLVHRCPLGFSFHMGTCHGVCCAGTNENAIKERTGTEATSHHPPLQNESALLHSASKVANENPKTSRANHNSGEAVVPGSFKRENNTISELRATTSQRFNNSGEHSKQLTIQESNKLITSTLGCKERITLPPLLLESKAIYTGQWKNCMRDGYGTIQWPDGSHYEGNWKDDKTCGQGKLVHADGDYYEGEWADDKANGYGIYVHSNGAKYIGQWVDDLQSGKGVETWPDGSRYEGDYYKGKKNGHGTLNFGDNSSYSGGFVNNDIQGQGVYNWPDGRRYVGEWHKNKMHGQGKISWADGRSYEGSYSNDQKNGQGTFRWPDGRRYTGAWKNGRQHGRGIYVNSTGEEKKGEWIDGKRVRWIDEQGNTIPDGKDGKESAEQNVSRDDGQNTFNPQKK